MSYFEMPTNSIPPDSTSRQPSSFNTRSNPSLVLISVSYVGPRCPFTGGDSIRRTVATPTPIALANSKELLLSATLANPMCCLLIMSMRSIITHREIFFKSIYSFTMSLFRYTIYLATLKEVETKSAPVTFHNLRGAPIEQPCRKKLSMSTQNPITKHPKNTIQTSNSSHYHEIQQQMADIKALIETTKLALETSNPAQAHVLSIALDSIGLLGDDIDLALGEPVTYQPLEVV